MRRVSHPTVLQSLAGSAVLPCVFTLQTNSSAQTPHLLWTRSASQPGEAGASPQQVVLSAKGESENLLIGSTVEGTCSLRRVFFHHCTELSRQRLGALFTVITKPCTVLQLVILKQSHSKQCKQPHEVRIRHRGCSDIFTLNNLHLRDCLLNLQ